MVHRTWDCSAKHGIVASLATFGASDRLDRPSAPGGMARKPGLCVYNRSLVHGLEPGRDGYCPCPIHSMECA